METETLLLQAIECTTIDQITGLLADYLNQAVLVTDQHGHIISQGRLTLTQVPADWLSPTDHATAYHQGQYAFIRHIVNPLALNNWYFFTAQAKSDPLISHQVQLALQILNHFIDRYALNPNQGEVNNLLATLLAHPTTTDVSLLRRVVGGRDRIVCVTATAKTTNQTEFVTALRDLITPSPLTEDSQQELIFLLNEADLPKLRPQLARLGQEFDHYFFISEAYQDVVKTPEFLQICRQASHLAHQLHTATIVNSTQKYNIYIILSQVKDSSLLKNTMCAQLLFLKQYDDDHHTALFATLYEFLENDCRINTTAEQLHLHRNSLSKRLAKIQGLIEIDFDNPDKTFGFRLSYRLFNYLQLQ
ncbi:PucR family transcriptional regulator [Levilactobacillus fujinensis]|uniref:PucR family transcriptional regulator n=1 Tax=Levilactobacillus fujinensis TaxID=2486024 RepID=A0ABW1TKG3_9LACO|nr:helix-turn-helix domain-containing protein [Levilactobacillus fujinensis]